MPLLPLCTAPAALAACALAFAVHAARELSKLQGTLVRLSHLPWEAGEGDRGVHSHILIWHKAGVVAVAWSVQAFSCTHLQVCILE